MRKIEQVIRTGVALGFLAWCSVAAAQGAGQEDGVAETRPLNQPQADWEVQPRSEAHGQHGSGKTGATEDGFGIDRQQTSRTLNRPTPPTQDIAE